jgi:hypothetical protein
VLTIADGSSIDVYGDTADVVAADFAFAGVQPGAHMDAERLHRVALARIAASVLAFVEQFVCSVRSTARRSPRGSTTIPLRVAVARSRWFQSRADHRAIVSG